MKFLEEIAANAASLAVEFSNSVVACAFLVSVFALISVFMIRSIIAGLFAIHRSNTALKKVNKAYSFGQKLLLKHAWNDCLHAKGFCRFLIVCHHILVCLFLLELLLSLLSGIWPSMMLINGYIAIFFMFVVTIPISILFFSRDKYPFNTRRHEFRFRKYHNSQDHHSLW